jgi:hypothetical protein
MGGGRAISVFLLAVSSSLDACEGCDASASSRDSRHSVLQDTQIFKSLVYMTPPSVAPRVEVIRHNCTDRQYSDYIPRAALIFTSTFINVSLHFVVDKEISM